MVLCVFTCGTWCGSGMQLGKREAMCGGANPVVGCGKGVCGRVLHYREYTD